MLAASVLAVHGPLWVLDNCSSNGVTGASLRAHFPVCCHIPINANSQQSPQSILNEVWQMYLVYACVCRFRRGSLTIMKLFHVCLPSLFTSTSSDEMKRLLVNLRNKIRFIKTERTERCWEAVVQKFRFSHPRFILQKYFWSHSGDSIHSVIVNVFISLKTMIRMMINEDDDSDCTHTGRVFRMSAICLIFIILALHSAWTKIDKTDGIKTKQDALVLEAQPDHVQIDAFGRIMCLVHYKAIQHYAVYLLCVLLQMQYWILHLRADTWRQSLESKSNDHI